MFKKPVSVLNDHKKEHFRINVAPAAHFLYHRVHFNNLIYTDNLISATATYRKLARRVSVVQNIQFNVHL